MMTATAKEVHALPVQLLTSGSTTTPEHAPLGLDVKGTVFVRARHRTVGDADPTTRLDLNRARLSLKLSYGELLKLKISPDLDEAPYLADAYLEVRPLDELRVRVGQQKVPFGQLEWRSRWEIPTVNRGIVTNQLSRRLGFSDRRVGALGEVRIKAWPLKPSLELGAFDNGDVNDRYDVAARFSVKPLKGADVAVAYYRREEAKISGGAGQAGQLSLEYDKRRVWILAEVLIGRARRLTLDGVPIDQDATFLGARAIVAYSFKFDAFRAQPYLGGELLDPGLKTTSDLGYSVRGGVNLLFWERLRVSLEAERTQGPAAFVLPDSTTFTMFLGMRVG